MSFAGRLIEEITEYDVERFRALRRSTPVKNGQPRSAATCNRELACLKGMLNKAVAWGFLEKNPAANVKLLPEPRGRTRYLSVEGAGKLLNVCPSHLRPIVLCALETGMRRGEILNLRWEDVDLKNGPMYIGETKTGASRHVPMSERLRRTLQKLPRRLGTDYVFVGRKGLGEDGAPFRDVNSSFERACSKAVIEHFRFHDLRHTAASHMVMAGVPLRTVGEILGHKTSSMTERYAHLSPEHKRKAVESLPDWGGAAADGTREALSTSRDGK